MLPCILILLPGLACVTHRLSAADSDPAQRSPAATVTAGVAKNIQPASDARTHWAFQPLSRPSLPKIQTPKSETKNLIDAFVQTRLAQENLSPSPEADRPTLIRRLYLDMLGLPPAFEEVQRFVEDRSVDAYEKLVDRVLASPRFGERWARHWLDVVRFAETHGFEMNQPRNTAWPYRDYVIRAFNEDKSYDQFIREQLAGDTFGADEATGFLVGGAWDQVKSPDVVLTRQQRADELHDMVATTGSALLGLTIGCARCHDHKFDPIPQTDYYAVKACLAGVQHGERKLNQPEDESKTREASEHRRRLEQIERALEDFEPLATVGGIDTNHFRPSVNARRNMERLAPTPIKRLRFTVTRTTDAEPCIDELEVYSADAAPRNLALASAGTTATASSVYPNSDIHRLEHLNDGRHGNSRSWISNERGKGWVELEFPQTVIIDKIVWGRDREQKYTDRLALDYRIEVAVETNDWRLVASSADRQPYVAGRTASATSSFASRAPEERSRINQLLAERAEHEARLKQLIDAPMVYAGRFDAMPEETFRLHRGDPMQPRDPVFPGGLTTIAPRLEPPRGPDEPQRRLALAQWITDPRNPLTARVMVNRLWQHHFGAGIVSTPSDFGVNGARPSHPELLDWLATEFIASGWKLKSVHRLILLSHTYRQASASNPTALAADAGNRLLWRFAPCRLEAEPIRDSILWVSGALDLRMGGPGYSPFEPNDNYVRVYESRKDFGPVEWRRMIYQMKPRNQQDATFGAFDCPDGAQIAPRRTSSTTPLQALNLLNSHFLMQQADFFAERLKREAGSDERTQIAQAFETAFSRHATKDELAAAEKFVHEQGLVMFCRAMFNANEFLYVF